ncbi:MAG: DUF5107 domain-containing protein [Planctomycetes bacterium]|nr:DUF5107 domain-containing protein [Planctomycetota bacterium]
MKGIPYPQPGSVRSGVRAWRAPIVLPTYLPAAGEVHPQFFERRVYQGSSGRVYPLPFIGDVADEPVARAWDAWFLENEYVHLVVLPELGGRIQRAYDKTAAYDFFYRQDVIKPALVGLAGPWISGGVEFNWPQHHRPATFLPTDARCTPDAAAAAADDDDEGARTVWLADHDPMSHMRSLLGIRLRSGSSLIEAEVRLTNRTAHRQTFLWWANVAARVHDRYQSFFPPDVTFVADHAVRAMSSFPIARQHYYGIDYRPGTDLTWWRNIPVPTSYMVLQTAYDFFGGYDHEAGAGFVHVADRRVAPGKKQWTWGNSEFGRAWERELTDDNGPYIELMAGVFTDNQPDFAYLLPYETKTFRQHWWPIQGIGPVQQASTEAAISFALADGEARIGIATSRPRDVVVVLRAGGRTIAERRARIAPGAPLLHRCAVGGEVRDHDCEVVVHAGARVLLRHRPPRRSDGAPPPPATAAPPPEQLASNDLLYLTGEHLELYRHPTRDPEQYWEEALRRDADDARCRTALGARLLRRGLAADAEAHLRRAVARLTQRHPNPIDGESHYLLGLALRAQGRDDEAFAPLAKCTWSSAWHSAGSYQLGCIECHRGDWAAAVDRFGDALQGDAANAQARIRRATALRRLGRFADARADVDRVLDADPLDHRAGFEHLLLDRAERGVEPDFDAWRTLHRGEPRTLLDLWSDECEAGCWEEAAELVDRGAPATDHPMLCYAAAFAAAQGGDEEACEELLLRARSGDDRCVFPDRPAEERLLRWVLERARDDALAPRLLGHLCYDARRHRDAIAAWTAARQRGGDHPGVLRCLGLAAYNVEGDAEGARALYAAAVAAAPTDGRLLFELDQLRKRLGDAPADRLALLEARRDTVEHRDDLCVELATLWNLVGRHEEARALLATRRFHPWEGGEGKVLQQHVATHLALSRSAFARGAVGEALALAERALAAPENLGEAPHPLASRAHVHVQLGRCARALGDANGARDWFERAAAMEQDFTGMAVRTFTAMSYFKGLALRELGREADARALFTGLRDHAETLAHTPAEIDYFATSLPDLLVFRDDLRKRQDTEARFLRALADLGLGAAEAAVAGLRDVLARDPSHQGAVEALADADPVES